MTAEDSCKVERAIERYDIESRDAIFDSINDELLSLWKGDGDREPLGYRSLAEWFNKQLLRSVYEANDRILMGSRRAEEFDILTGDDDIARGELVDELATDGIDGEQLHADMVSFSTIRRHLTGCLDGDKKRQKAQTDWEKNSVEIATDTLREKVSRALSSYETKGDIPGATAADVEVQIQLSCPHCPTRRTLTEARRIGYVCAEHLSGKAAEQQNSN